MIQAAGIPHLRGHVYKTLVDGRLPHFRKNETKIGTVPARKWYEVETEWSLLVGRRVVLGHRVGGNTEWCGSEDWNSLCATREQGFRFKENVQWTYHKAFVALLDFSSLRVLLQFLHIQQNLTVSAYESEFLLMVQIRVRTGL